MIVWDLVVDAVMVVGVLGWADVLLFGGRAGVWAASFAPWRAWDPAWAPWNLIRREPK